MENFCLHTNLKLLVPLQKIWLWQSPSKELEPPYAPTKNHCVGCCWNCPGEAPSRYSPGARWTQRTGSANICGDNIRIYTRLTKKLDRIHSATLQDEELQKTVQLIGMDGHQGHRCFHPYMGVKFEPGCQYGGLLLVQRLQRQCQHIGSALQKKPLKDGTCFSQHL